MKRNQARIVSSAQAAPTNCALQLSLGIPAFAESRQDTGFARISDLVGRVEVGRFRSQHVRRSAQRVGKRGRLSDLGAHNSRAEVEPRLCLRAA